MPNILVVDKTSPVSLAVATLCGYADVDVQVYDISSDWAKKNFASSSSQVPELRLDRVYTEVADIISALSNLSHKSLGGHNHAEKKQISSWIDIFKTQLTNNNSQKCQRVASELNQHFSSQSANAICIAGDEITAADVFLFVGLYHYFDSLKDEDRFRLCDFSRWFDLVQHRLVTHLLPLRLPLVEINLDSSAVSSNDVGENGAIPVSRPERKEKPVKNLSKEEVDRLRAEKQAKKKEKQAKKNKGKKEPPTLDIVKFDIRVGRILSIKKHPNADRLLVEQVDIGEKTIQVVSGLAEHYPKFDILKNALVCVGVNVKEGQMQGEVSKGLILCASNESGLDIVHPPENAKVGERITFTGALGDADTILAPKKLHKIQKLLQCKDGTAFYANLPFTTTGGVCFASKDGHIK